MPSTNYPKNAVVVRTYKQLDGFVSAFTEGKSVTVQVNDDCRAQSVTLLHD